MRSLFLFFTLMVFLPSRAQQTNHVFLSTGFGQIIPGRVPDSASFRGNDVSLALGYSWLPSKRFGIAPQIGLAIYRYRHDFDKSVFLQHRQTGFVFSLPAFFQPNEKMTVSAGILAYVPFADGQQIGQQRSDEFYFFSTDALGKPYVPSRLQAGPVIGFDYAPGKKRLFSFGLQISRFTTSPVSADARYADFLGNQITISKALKPVHISARLVFVITKGKKNSAN